MQTFAKENIPMYTPRAFAIDELSQLHELILATRLAILVTQGESGLQASHVPVLLHCEQGSNGTLYGHLAKANPQWKDLRDGAEALLILPVPTPTSAPASTRARPNTAKSCQPGTTSPYTPMAEPKRSAMAGGCWTSSAPSPTAMKLAALNRGQWPMPRRLHRRHAQGHRRFRHSH